MSRKKSKTPTPPVSKKEDCSVSIEYLSQQDILRLMMAKIVAGMLSSSKYDKFNPDDMVITAKDLAIKIIDATP